MIVGIQDEILKVHALGLLELLLADKTSKAGLIWAADAYSACGENYRRDKEIKAALITGANSGIIKNRARKELEQQSERVRRRAEVFTPLPVCRKMLDYMDMQWFGREGAFAGKRVQFPPKRSWQSYVDSRRLEITCGEAPYLVQRYDVLTGEIIPLEQRSGILDRKLRAVSENAADEAEWRKWALRAYQASYGFDFQGDNVLIARLNLLLSYEDYLYARWRRRPESAEYKAVANTVAWNVWQMDGLTGRLPYCRRQARYRQLGLFAAEADAMPAAGGAEAGAAPPSRIYDWRRDNSLEYLHVNRGGKRNMKFDFIIGNPPYQEETIGDNKGFAPPIYHKFLEAAFPLANAVEMIHPARFLFDAGSTPKQWNKKMLNDPHLKVIFYEADGTKIFPGTDIKGGIAITYHNSKENFGSIQTFTAFPELNSILKKVTKTMSPAESLDTIINTQLRFNLDVLYTDYPEYKLILGSNGKDSRFRNNIFDKVALFTNRQTQDDDIKVIGVVKNKRTWKYIQKKYVDMEHANVLKYKVLVPRANGSGALGETLSTPLIGTPLIGYTQTFIGLGVFETEVEATALFKYMKSKFARCMLGILKVTQDNDRPVWRLVPLQDFTPNSDIDWSQSIPDIDRQLYAKYGLDEQEIEFIETHVKEMA